MAGQPPSRAHRTQQMRTAETQDKLVRATLDVLYSGGHEGFTTQRVCDVAGVSRGAMLHHFPTRATLLVAAIGRLLDDAIADIRALAGRVHSHEMSLDAFVDALWRDHFANRLFYITLEYITVARADIDVRQSLIPVVRRFHAALDETWREVFPTAAMPANGVAVILNLTLCLLRGMGVQTVLRPDDAPYYESLLVVWKAVMAALIAGEVQDFAALARQIPHDASHLDDITKIETRDGWK